MSHHRLRLCRWLRLHRPQFGWRTGQRAKFRTPCLMLRIAATIAIVGLGIWATETVKRSQTQQSVDEDGSTSLEKWLLVGRYMREASRMGHQVQKSLGRRLAGTCSTGRGVCGALVPCPVGWPALISGRLLSLATLILDSLAIDP